MPSFKGITFGERGNNAQDFPAWSRAAVVSVVHYPGGNNNAIISGGQDVSRLALRIRCDADAYTDLLAAVGSSGTLVFSRGSFSAFLESVPDATEILVSGKLMATLNLIRT